MPAKAMRLTTASLLIHYFSKSVMSKESKPESKETKTDTGVPHALKEIINTADFKTFLFYKAAAGEIGSPDDVGTLSDDQADSLHAEFGRWEAAGKPKPEMPKTKDLPRITAIYRDKIFGKNKIYCYLSGTGAERHGLEIKGDGKKNYTLEDTATQRKKLLDQALKTAEHESDVGLYVRAGRLKWALTPKEFMEDYDALVTKYMATIQLKTPS